MTVPSCAEEREELEEVCEAGGEGFGGRGTINSGDSKRLLFTGKRLGYMESALSTANEAIIADIAVKEGG
jgi:hypothetical protein